MRRLAIFPILLGSLVSHPALAGRVVDVRVGAHAEKTRIVIELDEPSGYRIGQQEIPTATGIVTELVVQMEATGAFALAGRRGLVESVRIKPQGEGAVALIRLTTQTPTINDMALENPHRIVIDVARGGTAAPPPNARPPAPVVEPEFTEPPPDVIVGTAPRATQLGGPPSTTTAKPVAVPPAEKPAAAAPTPAVAATPPPTAAAPAPTAAAPAAPAPSPAPAPGAEPGAAPTPPSPGEPTGPQTATAPEAPPAVGPPAATQPPAPALPPRPSLERPGTAPAIEPGGRAATLPQLIEMLRTDPRVIGSAALVAALFVLWLLLRRRSSAARRRRVEPFPPLPPLDGLAPAVDERDLVGPVREEPAPAAAAPIEDELPAPKRAARTSWRDPLPGTRPAQPAAAPTAAPVSAARFEPPPPAWNEVPPPPEPDQAELWDESDLEPEAPAEEEAALSEPPSDLAPPPAPAASAETERELRELERRLRHLETRLEEATEARERMERQLAANAEELRVQRSAIARTQRVVRSLAQPDAGTKEPLRGPGS